MVDKNIEFYSNNAKLLAKQYDAVITENVHKDWIKYLSSAGLALDVGAGSGRDSLFLAQQGFKVTAVEPAKTLRELAQDNNPHPNITWLDDKLPELKSVFNLQIKYDLILLSAVWMHIPPSNRERAFRKLSCLLKPNGKLVISLRHGECHDERKMYKVTSDELSNLSSQFGLSFKLINDGNTDELGRHDVWWQTVILELPDDSTGAFPLIRNIVVNDNKSSTYKLALLRTLLRIAEGHPGAVIEQTDNQVKLPLGLVALYWLKLYKPLIDKYLYWSSNTGHFYLRIFKLNW